VIAIAHRLSTLRAMDRIVVLDPGEGEPGSEVRAQFPRAEIVHDLFHVVVEYGRQVIDRSQRGRRQSAPNISHFLLDNSGRPLRDRQITSLTLALRTS
jgi:hypothetical protein